MEKYYDSIFRRRSFHHFRNREEISPRELCSLREFIGRAAPLDRNIKTLVEIVPESQTTCRRGAQYCILFYSQTSGNYLRNIGYIGEQIYLFLASKHIGALWFGIGKPQRKEIDGLDFVIMIAIAKMPEQSFRKDMFKAKRKPLDEFWRGDPLGVAEIVRFSPSACNTQPWIVENNDDSLLVFRYTKPGKRGIMPADKVQFYNSIDCGIFLAVLEICLSRQNVRFERILYADSGGETALAARYNIKTN